MAAVGSTGSSLVFAEKKKNPEVNYEMKHAMKEIKQRLETPRRNLRLHGIQPSPIAVKSLQEESYEFSFQYPSRAETVRIIGKFAAELETDGKILEVHSSSVENPSDQLLAFKFADDSGSMLLHASRNSSLHDFSYYIKGNTMTEGEIQALVESYKAAWTSSSSFEMPMIIRGGRDMKDSTIPPPAETKDEAIATLEKMGIRVYNTTGNTPNDDEDSDDKVLDWDSMAGYDKVKEEIRDTLVLALQNPQVYENIAEKTRERYESNRPRAILFEGPPGTGKTLSARILAQQTGLVMVHIPVESVVSKWYGESEKNMAAIFEACNKLDGAILFIDEIDALATDRGSTGGIHEVSRRMLSVLLQKIEGFEQMNQRTTVVCATNRKEDLDSALLSRFGLTIRFDLPNSTSRESIFTRYAKHLTSNELKQLGQDTEGFSCRDIKEMCEHTERKWASKLLRKETSQELPNIEAYLSTVQQYIANRTPHSAIVNC